MKTTSQQYQTIPTFADYQAPETDTDMLPFVQCSPDRTLWSHWQLERPSSYDEQENYGYRLGAHLVQYLISSQGGQHNSLLRNIVEDISKAYSDCPDDEHFAGDDWFIVVTFFEFIEKMLAAHIPPETNVLDMAEEYIQALADELEAEAAELAADNEPDTPPLPHMVREVVTNIPGWWHGEAPVIEYEAARWALGGNIERKPFKTLNEAEAWAQGGSHHG